MHRPHHNQSSHHHRPHFRRHGPPFLPFLGIALFVFLVASGGIFPLLIVLAIGWFVFKGMRGACGPRSWHYYGHNQYDDYDGEKPKRKNDDRYADEKRKNDDDIFYV